MAPRILLAAGTSDAERILLEALDHARAAPAVLAPPIRVVVPSHSLRDHLAVALLRHRGRAVVGIEITTHHAVARSIVQRVDSAVDRGSRDGTLPALIVARRGAAGHPVLRRLLGAPGRADAFAAVADAVDDLLDAGLEAAHVAALDELLLAANTRGVTPPEVMRARAVLAVAGQTAEALERDLEAGITDGHTVALLRRATHLVARGEGALTAHSLFVHGYADATGVVTDFLEALINAANGTLIVNLPPVAGDPNRQEIDHPARLLLRFGHRQTAQLSAIGPPPRIRFTVAEDPAAELDLVAMTIRRLLDAGHGAETVGVVAPDLAPYANVLESAFRRRGIAFSSPSGDGPIDPAGRRLAALEDFLAGGSSAGPRLPVDRFLDLVAPPADEVEPGASSNQGALSFVKSQLDTATRNRLLELAARRGMASIGDLAALASEAENDETSLSPWDDFEDDATDDRLLQCGARAAAAACESWRQANEQAAPADAYRSRITALLDGPLAWPRASRARRRLDAALTNAWSRLPTSLEISLEEALLVARPALAAARHQRLGGLGGGVQVLDAVSARGRNFAHLFVVGLLRDRFPRRLHGDPLLTDRLRREMLTLLPDLAIRSRSQDEERYRFSELASASPSVHLSASRHDERGRPRALSSFVSSVDQVSTDEPRGDVLSFDQGLREAAISHDPTRLRPWLEVGFRRAQSALEGAAAAVDPAAVDPAAVDTERPTPVRLANARLAVVAAFEPPPGTGHSMEPFLGLVGPATEATDPRCLPLAITTLESLAECPWQTFLERVLGLRPVLDPLAALPGLEPAWIGTLAHRVLERVAGGWTDSAGRARWPEDGELDALIARQADRLLEAHGLHFRAMARAAAARVRPLVLAAEEDWAQGFTLIAAEVATEFEIQDDGGKTRRIHMRVDRVDRTSQPAGSGLRLTDYKTGKPYVSAADPAARRRGLRVLVAAGRRLQAVAGLEATVAGERPAASRYHFLDPDLADEQRSLVAARHDRDLRATFVRSLSVLAEALDAGALFPRLSHSRADEEPRRCGRCAVRDACLRGDSDARRRQRGWAESIGGRSAGPGTAIEVAARELWNLDRETES